MATAEALMTAEEFGQRPDPAIPRSSFKEGSSRCPHRIDVMVGPVSRLGDPGHVCR